MLKFLAVSLGGALGSGARYLLSSWMQSLLGAAFPFGTLAVNLVGSFLICAIMRLGGSAEVISPGVRLFLTTGILGGFTTYSAFDFETFRFSQQGAYGLASLYVGVTVVACFAAGAAGDLLARLLVRG